MAGFQCMNTGVDSPQEFTVTVLAASQHWRISFHKPIVQTRDSVVPIPGRRDNSLAGCHPRKETTEPREGLIELEVSLEL